MLVFIICYLYLLASVVRSSRNKTEDQILDDFMAEEKRLVNFIFSGYQKSIPALYIKARSNYKAPRIPLLVNLTLNYVKMLELKEPEQTIKMIAESYIEWQDRRLAWNPANFSDIDVILVGRENIWLPDVLPFDIADAFDTVPIERQSVVIYANGAVSFYLAGVTTFMCHLDISDFPFDFQICSVQYSSYYSTASEMVISPRFVNNFNYEAVGSNAWNYVNHSISSRIFLDGMHNLNFSTIKFQFKLRRSDSYYIILIIIPSFVLTFLCMAGLFWAPIFNDTYMDKLNLGFAAILAMVLVLQMTTDNIPKTSQMPILSIYSLNNLALITLASLGVLVIGKYGSNNRRRDWAKKYPRLDWISRNCHIFCLFFFTAATIVNLIVLLSRKGAKEHVNAGFDDF